MPRKKKAAVLATLTLTAEELEPIRTKASRHKEAAAKFVSEAIKKELALQERGEVAELTVPQFNAFDLNAAFKTAALRKAQLAGFNAIRNLRKDQGSWVFEAYHEAAA